MRGAWKKLTVSCTKRLKTVWVRGSETYLLRSQNERLGDEIRMHVELTSSLRKDIDTLQAEAAGVCRDIGLLKEADNLHIQRSSNQARVIAQSNTKVVTLEKSIGSVVRQYGAERRALEEEHQKVLNDFEVERQTLRRIILTKTKELRKVKQLAQQVLHERGEVEAFLVDSLEIVLQELRDSKSSTPLTKGVLKKADRKPVAASARSGQSTPKQHSGTSSRFKRPQKAGFLMERQTEMDILQQMEEVPVKLEPTVDISQLSWHDREKVLRYLFAKINQAHQIPNHVAVTHNRAKYQELFGSDDESEDLQMAFFGSVSDGGRVLV